MTFWPRRAPRPNQNAEARVCMISPYPPKGQKHSATSSMGSYAKNLCEALAQPVLVLGESDKAQEESRYEEGAVEVHRCWRKGLSYVFQICRAAFRVRRDVGLFHVQHEYFLFGGALTAALFPVMLWVLRTTVRRPVVVTLHGVLPLAKLDADFVRKNGLRGQPKLLRLGIRWTTKMICLAANRVIVHEEHFAALLREEYSIPTRKISVIPHGVEEPREAPEREVARQRLGIGAEKVILFFGYLAGYKGLDILVESLRFLNKDEDYSLIVAGGMHPRLRSDAGYVEAVRGLEKRARELSRHVVFTGFVREESIPLFFRAADVAVFPYRDVIAGSGPLSLALAYRTPVLLSAPLAKSLSLEGSACCFVMDPRALAEAVRRFFEDEDVRRDVSAVVEALRAKRLWTVVARTTVGLYRELLDGHGPAR